MESVKPSVNLSLDRLKELLQQNAMVSLIVEDLYSCGSCVGMRRSHGFGGWHDYQCGLMDHKEELSTMGFSTGPCGFERGERDAIRPSAMAAGFGICLEFRYQAVLGLTMEMSGAREGLGVGFA